MRDCAAGVTKVVFVELVEEVCDEREEVDEVE